MSRKLIGTGITDENGEATITYTGTGAGRLNIVAESGTFTSKPHSVLDCMWYDEGKNETGKHNDIWRTVNSSISRNSNYTTITSSAQWGSAYLTGGQSITAQVDLLADNDIICIEFDAVGTHIVGNQGFNIRWNDGTNHYWGCSNGEGHTKVYISHTEFYVIVEDIVKAHYTNQNIPNAYLQSVASEPNMEVKFANLKIYPVNSIPSF